MFLNTLFSFTKMFSSANAMMVTSFQSELSNLPHAFRSVESCPKHLESLKVT